MLETDRLILREWEPKDLKPFTALNQDPRVTEFLGKRYSNAEIAELINKIKAHFEKWGYGLFACVLKETSTFIGYIGLNVPTFEAAFTPCVEIGWRICYSAWGKGYATEAALRCLKAAFEEYGLNEILSWTSVENIRSRKVMEKIGMSRVIGGDFHYPNISHDHPLSLHVLYKITKDEYEKCLGK